MNKYLDFNSNIEETIILISGTFIVSIAILVYYVFFAKQDMPPNIMNFLEVIWGGTVGSYISKTVNNIVKRNSNGK